MLLGLAAVVLCCTLQLAFAQDTKDRECRNPNHVNIVQQPELAKRPTDYVILNCTISKIPWKYVKYYRWYMKDENDKEIHICINRLNHSDATDLNAHNCIFNHIFLNKVNESHYISSDSIHTAISIHVQLNDSYKYICETKLKNISRCDTEHGIKYKDPHIAIALDPKISNEIYDPQAIYVVRCSVNAPRGIPVIDLDYNGTKKELFKIKAANTTKRKHQVVKDAYVSLPNVGNITCNISDSLGSYHKTKSIVFFQKGNQKPEGKSLITVLLICIALLISIIIILVCKQKGCWQIRGIL